ncbi:hypothetical protein EDB85DRAFT_1943189 [Lactarius pseudohatsudake]|nr:hypothetical protein EDB85DRAFT_1943189 [Lactarius pseudohatsudake]
MSNTGRHHVSPMAISTLNHDVLLNIFNWYRLGNTTGFDRGWNLERWWYKLIQVCRTWRHLILASPTRLDLHLVCTHDTPITTMLTHSPPLPLVIYYPGRLAAGEDGDMLFALQHRERVHRIHIKAPAASLPCLLNAMDGEYQVLQRLVIHSHTEKPCPASTGTGVQLPTKLQAPLLRRLTLTNVRIPADSELLRRAESLVTLELLDIADSPELHPVHLVSQLARMAQLERLVVHFRTALPNHAVERTLWGAPTTRPALPRLQLLSFRGGSAYLEGMLARISAPSVQKLFIDFFAQLTFDLPSLVRFVRAAQPSPEGNGGAIQRSQFHAAELHFDAETACMLLDSRTTDRGRPSGARTNPVQLRVSCRALDWQLASLAQICGALTPLFAHVEGLTLGLHTSHPKPDANSDCLDSDRAQWHALLRAFGGTKTLQLAGPHAAHLLHELLPLPAELLPALQELLPGDDGEPGAGEDDEGGLAAFTAEREAAGRPVGVVRDWW